jgi:sugar phosphate isomerase/epimerase
MILSCCAWALNDPEPEALTLLKEMGLTSIDIRPSWLRSDGALRKRKELDLDVICLAATHERPEGATLDSDSSGSVEPMVRHIKEGLDHAAEQGAHWSYVVPDRLVDDQTFERYATHLTDIADHAQSLDIKVCIEHFPGTAFPTVSSTMDFIHDTGHPNLYLLFDIGHAQMANEDPAEVLANVGDRLGYVHLDDNDGVNDLHLALTDGVQTTDSLADLLQVLNNIDYDGPISLEIKNDLPDPLDSVTRSYQIITDLLV